MPAAAALLGHEGGGGPNIERTNDLGDEPSQGTLARSAGTGKGWHSADALRESMAVGLKVVETKVEFPTTR